LINGTTSEKDNFKNEQLDRDSHGNILIAPFLQKVINCGFGLTGCAISVCAADDSFTFIGQEGSFETIKATDVDLSRGPLQLKYR
jgi:hypothetical protein